VELLAGQCDLSGSLVVLCEPLQHPQQFHPYVWRKLCGAMAAAARTEEGKDGAELAIFAQKYLFASDSSARCYGAVVALHMHPPNVPASAGVQLTEAMLARGLLGGSSVDAVLAWWQRVAAAWVAPVGDEATLTASADEMASILSLVAERWVSLPRCVGLLPA
jgi:hypothetical protein